ncbi:MAG: hypothetical protein ACO1OQ_09135 [Rufibacter sp.]
MSNLIKSESMIRTILTVIATITMLAGLSGMLFCFAYLWSSKMEDLVGAGFPFVAGAVLFGSGLVTLGLLNRTPTLQK